MSISISSTTDTPEQVQEALGAYGYEATAIEETRSSAEPEPAAAAEEQTEQKSEEDSSAASGEEAKSDEDSETSETEQQEQQGKKKGGFQRRIDKLTREKGDLERRVQELETKLAGDAAQGDEETDTEEEGQEAAAGETADTSERPKRPKQADFETYEAYEAALDKYDDDFAKWNEQRARDAVREERSRQAQQAKASEAQQVWIGKVEDAKSRYEDWDAVANNADVKVSWAMGEVITAGDRADVLYALGKHPEEAERIQKLTQLPEKATPAQIANAVKVAAIELAKLEAKLPTKTAAAEKKKPAVSEAPPPITRVKTNTAPSTGPDLNKSVGKGFKLDDYIRARKNRK